MPGLFKQQWEKYPNPPVAIYDTPLAMIQAADSEAATKKAYRTYIGGKTDSMLPTIARGDQIVFVKKPYAELKEGDIAMYDAPWHPQAPVIHRLVQKDKGGWIGSGDNNPRSEAQWRITDKNYKGVVISVHRIKKPEKKK